MIDKIIQQVQSQLLPSDDSDQFKQHMQTLDDSQTTRQDLIKKLNNIYDTLNLKVEPSTIYSTRIFEDLDFFNSKATSVFDIINRTETSFGEKYLRKLLLTPLDDTLLLKERQQKIKTLVQNPNLLKTIKTHLKNIKNTERTLLWFWNLPTEATNQLHELIYYNIPTLEHINENTLFMQLTNIYKIFATPAITVLSPFVTLVLPYIMLRIMGADVSISSIYETLTKQVSNMASKFSLGTSADGKPSPWVKYLSITMWVVFYLQSAYTSVITAYNTNTIVNNIHRKTNTVAQFVDSHTQLLTVLTKAGYKTEHILSQCTLRPMFDHQTFRASPQLFTNKGLILTSYYKLMKSKDQLIPAMQLIGELDTYSTIASLVLENNFTFVDFKNIESKSESKPYIKFKSLFHPSISQKRAITNSLDMSTNKSTNFLITGPNKAGKSTYIKSSILAIILGQTLTISNAKTAEFTPFSYIDSYLNIPDCEGKESLYEAELNRCYEHFLKVKEYQDQPNKFLFTIMDEIFSSTNNLEGQAAAYAILKKLTSFPNSASLITTHYYELASLEQDTKKRINNYKFSCEHKDDTIVFNYKIERGASDQYIALKLLKEKGFDKDVIEDAYKKFNNKNTTNRVSKKRK